MGIEDNNNRDEGILKALSNARVIKPGMRDRVSVPTAVVVAVPIR
jgi:hypothetical protein